MSRRRRGPHARAARGKLVDRDYEILEHLLRYRICTRESLRGQFFDDSELNAVSKVASRLEAGGFLTSHDLDPPSKYWTLGPEGCSLFGLSVKKTKPLGPQALLDDLGALLFCLAGKTPRKRLTLGEVSKRLPGTPLTELRQTRFYEELHGDDPRDRLGFVWSDGGRPPDSVVRKCAEVVRKKMDTPALRALAERKLLVMAIVTANKIRAEHLQEAIRRRADWPVEFRVAARPGLTPAVLRARR